MPPRDVAKNVNFGMLYGSMSSEKAARVLGVSKKTPLQGLVDGVFKEEFNLRRDQEIEALLKKYGVESPHQIDLCLNTSEPLDEAQ